MDKLYVYFSEDEILDKEILRNPVNFFDILEVKQTKIVDLILEKIEQAKYLSPSHFLSRYNEKLPIEFLSSGSKIAIVTTLVQDKIIDLREGGVNARDFIFNYIDNASVLAYSPRYGVITDESIVDKKFWCNGYTLTGIEQFSDYVYRDYPGEPNSCLDL